MNNDGEGNFLNDIKRELLYKPINKVLNWAEMKWGKKGWYIVASFIVLVSLFVGVIIFPTVSKVAGEKISGILSGSAQKAPLKGEPVAVPEAVQQTPLDDARILGISEKPCSGLSINIMQEMSAVPGEKPYQADSLDLSVVSASDSAKYQVAKRYPFSCKPPWVATFTFIPLKTQSIGVFFEYEDIFKFLIGNGDRITWVLQKNDQGSRKIDWTEFAKQKLDKGNIATNKEVTIVINLLKIEGNFVVLHIKIRYFPENSNSYEWVEFDERFNPSSIDLSADPTRSFRIGINESWFKGTGSEIKFNTFNVKSY